MSPLLFSTPHSLLTPDGVLSFDASSLWLLAQAQGGGVNPLTGLLPIAAMGLLIYFMFASQRTKNKQFQEMLSGLKENDRVVTTGGIHGVVTNVQRDAGRLTLRVDESNGTKIRVALWAIDSVVTEEK